MYNTILKYVEEGKKSGLQLTNWKGEREYVVHNVDNEGEVYQGDYFNRKYDDNSKTNSIVCFVQRLLKRISFKGYDRTDFIKGMYDSGIYGLMSFNLHGGNGEIALSSLQEVIKSEYISDDEDRAENSKIYESVLDYMLKFIIEENGMDSYEWEDQYKKDTIKGLMEYGYAKLTVFKEEFTIQCKEVDQIGRRGE